MRSPPGSPHGGRPLSSAPTVDPTGTQATATEIIYEIDDYDLASFTRLAACFSEQRFAYVVTPNVDHLLRFRDDAAFRTYYQKAGYILLDSRLAAYLLRIMKRIRLRVCTGSDLTVTLLSKVATPLDRIILIGGSREQADQIMDLYGLKNLRHHNPPMGFIRDPESVEACLRFIEAASPFRFCFIAVGSPQQEALAYELESRGVARGLALCVGAALNFVTGLERRAPRWMQHLALEWLYRLLQDPRRLAYRYLVRGPRIFWHLLRAQIVLRPADDYRSS